MGLPNEAIEETETAQCHVRNRFECPSFANSSQDDEDTSPSLVTTSSTLISFDLDQEAAQEEAATEESPADPTRAKLPVGLSAAKRKRPPKTCLDEAGQIAARTNERDNARGSCIAGKKFGGYDEEDSSLSSLVTTTSRTLMGSGSDQEVAQREPRPDDIVPSGWTRAKLEPSPASKKRRRTGLAERG